MIKNLIILLIGAVAVIGVGLGLSASNAPKPNFGAIAGPDIPYPYLNVNGNLTYYSSTQLIATSSIVCRIQNPAAATTTLQNFALNISASGLTAAQQFDLSTTTASEGYGSSTPAFIASGSIQSTANGPTYVAYQPMATSTGGPLIRVTGDGSSPFIIKPNEYLTVRIGTSTPRSFASYLTGSCSAEFRVIQ